MRPQKVVIIDYGVGNTHSVSNAIRALDYKVKISSDENLIKEADALILPGVGAFDEAMSNLKARNIDHILNEQVLVNKKPILGICVGMQMLATLSEENGVHNGLNWIEGKVVRFKLPDDFAVPHVGWNDIAFKNQGPLFERNDEHANFYFDHSYHFECAPEFVAASCNYGIEVTAAVQKGNIFGVQFHPEKSQTNGLKMFRSFIESV
ncbi:MAG TPA: imidazole glycerol phosphate synthase subunit HisH [Bacteroidia bacterium]|nr:imidazole glycerol phosphate synthase subunit HisH [Bacteroidia bacterium]